MPLHNSKHIGLPNLALDFHGKDHTLNKTCVWSFHFYLLQYFQIKNCITFRNAIKIIKIKSVVEPDKFD